MIKFFRLSCVGHCWLSGNREEIFEPGQHSSGGQVKSSKLPCLRLVSLDLMYCAYCIVLLYCLGHRCLNIDP